MLSKINNELRTCRLELAFLQSGELQPRDPLRLSDKEFKAFTDKFILHVNEAYPEECFSFEFFDGEKALLATFKHKSLTHTFEITQKSTIRSYNFKTAKGTPHSEIDSEVDEDNPITETMIDLRNFDQTTKMFFNFFDKLPQHTDLRAFKSNIDLKHLYHSVTKEIIDMNLDKTFTYMCETSRSSAFFIIEYFSNDDTLYRFNINKYPSNHVYIQRLQGNGIEILHKFPFNDIVSHGFTEYLNLYLTYIQDE